MIMIGKNTNSSAPCAAMRVLHLNRRSGILGSISLLGPSVSNFAHCSPSGPFSTDTQALLTADRHSATQQKQQRGFMKIVDGSEEGGFAGKDILNRCTAGDILQDRPLAGTRVIAMDVLLCPRESSIGKAGVSEMHPMPKHPYGTPYLSVIYLLLEAEKEIFMRQRNRAFQVKDPSCWSAQPSAHSSNRALVEQQRNSSADTFQCHVRWPWM